MIPNHKQFIEALSEKKRVSIRFYSAPDSGVLDRVCAPLDYGPGTGSPDGLHRYWVWDYSSNTGSHRVGLLPQQIVDLQVLGSVFDPAEFGESPWPWAVPRQWAPAAGAVEAAVSSGGA